MLKLNYMIWMYGWCHNGLISRSIYFIHYFEHLGSVCGNLLNSVEWTCAWLTLTQRFYLPVVEILFPTMLTSRSAHFIVVPVPFLLCCTRLICGSVHCRSGTTASMLTGHWRFESGTAHTRWWKSMFVKTWLHSEWGVWWLTLSNGVLFR